MKTTVKQTICRLNAHPNSRVMYRFTRLLTKLFTTLLSLLVLSVPAAVAAETITYLIPDAQGSTIMKMDEAGSVIWKADHLPFGKNITPDNSVIDNNPLQYTGAPLDNHSGLTYLKARYYNADIGRFYAMDPIWFREKDIQTFNRYTYANNSPYVYTDPTGKAICGGICVGFIVGFIAKAAISGAIDAGVQKATTGDIDVEQVAISAAFGGLTTPGVKSALAVNTATAATIDIKNDKELSLNTLTDGISSTIGGHYLGKYTSNIKMVKDVKKSVKALNKNTRVKNDPKGFHNQSASKSNREIVASIESASDSVGTGVAGNLSNIVGHLSESTEGTDSERENENENP